MAASVFTLPFQVAKTYGLGQAAPVDHAPEASTQSYKRGAVLISSSGKIATAAADPTLATIVGVANHNASGVTNTDVEYILPLPHVIFEGTFSNGGNQVAVAQTDLWVAYGIAVDSTTKKWYVDKADTTHVRVVIVGFRDAIGTSDARVYFTFIDGGTVYSPVAAS